MMSIIKNIFTLVGLVLVAGLGYYIYIGSSNNELETSGMQMSIEAESNDLVKKIEILKRTSIDQSIFTDPRFTNLRSFATPVPVYPVGRDNPFQPLE